MVFRSEELTCSDNLLRKREDDMYIRLYKVTICVMKLKLQLFTFLSDRERCVRDPTKEVWDPVNDFVVRFMKLNTRAREFKK